jgi:hypothetical protein
MEPHKYFAQTHMRSQQAWSKRPARLHISSIQTRRCTRAVCAPMTDASSKVKTSDSGSEVGWCLLVRASSTRGGRRRDEARSRSFGGAGSSESRDERGERKKKRPGVWEKISTLPPRAVSLLVLCHCAGSWISQSWCAFEAEDPRDDKATFPCSRSTWDKNAKTAFYFKFGVL